MKKEEWNQGLNHLDSDLVEEYVTKKDRLANKKAAHAVWMRIGVIAACLCLLASAVLVAPMLTKQSPGDVPDQTSDNATSDTTDEEQRFPLSMPEQSFGPLYYGDQNSVSNGDSFEVSAAGISVTARFIEALPDTYCFFDDWRQIKFRLIQMETVKLLNGVEMVEEFYYIIPLEYMTDFSVYHTFVLKDMAQFGFEKSNLFNQTQGCAEQIPLTIFGYSNATGYHHLSAHVMAFDAEGYLDLGLWKSTEKWISSVNSSRYESEAYSLSQIEEEAKHTYYDYFRVNLLSNATGEAKEVLEYVQSLENGLFVSNSTNKLYLSPKLQVTFRKYLNGFATNEHVRIFGDSITFSDPEYRFTKQDEERLPDLASALATVAAACEEGLIVAPHFQKASDASAIYGVFGWYAKTKEGVLGIVRVTWRFSYEGKRYYDDAYYVVEYGSEECRFISRDALLEIHGEKNTAYIYSGGYDENGKTW